jgi:hypothetical protein
VKSSNKYILDNVVTGFFVLVILSVLLFWARFLVCHFFQSFTPNPLVGIRPSHIIPPEIETDPNVVSSSFVNAYLHDTEALMLGISQILSPENQPDKSGLCSFDMGFDEKKLYAWYLNYFDRKLGLFVHCILSRKTPKGKTQWVKEVRLYAGPKGASSTPDKALGRFRDPLVPRDLGYPWPMPVYDPGQKRFFLIKFWESKVIKGPELPKDYEPIQISYLVKNQGFGHLHWRLPLKKATEEQAKDRDKILESWYQQGIRTGLVAVSDRIESYRSRKNIMVLDKSGWISMLDGETLELTQKVGFLPSAPPFDVSALAKPHELLAYEIFPFHMDGEYLGQVALSISREGTALAVSVFDAEGKLLAKKDSGVQLMNQAGGPATMIANYILENLQPLTFSLISHFTASSFEATAGHRALFILPNSFVAMCARASQTMIERFLFALLLILPSIVLGVSLAFHVRKNAAAVGLSRNTKLCWTIGTIAFGLAAYITYRLTRPKITLVTCPNCGKLRRPDMDRCHRCGSKWHIPELTPPAWRVLNGAEQVS